MIEKIDILHQISKYVYLNYILIPLKLLPYT